MTDRLRAPMSATPIAEEARARRLWADDVEYCERVHTLRSRRSPEGT